MNNLDFLNSNTVRNYPIKDGLSRVSLDGLLTIPNDLIADITIACPAVDDMRLFISRIINSTTSINIEISETSLSVTQVVGNFYIVVASATEYKDYSFIPSTDFPNTKGILTIGTLDNTVLQPSGEFTFDITATELLMRVYSPASSGVNFIAFSDAKGNRKVLTGIVNVLAESNLQFREIDSSTIAIDAGEGLGLNKNCDIAAVPIKTINGVRPDSAGNFYLIPGNCLAIETAEFGLVLDNTCGKPCVGCTEIGTLTDRLVALESDLLKARDYVVNLQGLITQLTTLVNFSCECE